MKVVQLVMSRQYRGAEIFAWQLSKHLTAIGEDVLYVSMFAVSGKAFIPEGISWKDMSANRTKGINFSLLFSLAKIFKEYKPDIVQANAGETLKYAVLAKLLFGLKFQIVFRNASMVSQYIKHPGQKWFNNFLYKRVSWILSVSNSSMRDFISIFPSVQHKISMISNGVDLREVNPTSVMDKYAFNLVHVGGFTFEKNHLGLLNIYARIKNIEPNAFLWLVGDGPLRKRIEEAVQYRAIQGVQFLGAVANPMEYVSASRVLVLPSILEGLPGVILEAMSCRTPVVAFDVGGISEVIKNNETGWLVEANDEDGFVKSVLEVFRMDASKLSDVTDNAYQAVNKFDNRVIAKRFLEVYQKL